MKKQNRALLFLLVFSVLVIGSIAWREDFWEKLKSGSTVSESSSPTQAISGELTGESQESMGDLVKNDEKNSDPTQISVIKDGDAFFRVFKPLADCLEIKAALPTVMTNRADTLVNFAKGLWGEVERTDQWINWQYRLKDNVERKLRVEVQLDEQGVPGRTLQLFAIDKDGVPVAIEIEASKSRNPSDEVIYSYLKEGEVFLKEKQEQAAFKSGQIITLLERNDQLDSFDVRQGEAVFRCLSLKNPGESCSCTKGP